MTVGKGIAAATCFLLGMLSLPATGAASTINGYVGADQAVYTAGSGEANDLTVTYDAGTDTYTFTDAGVATVTDGDGVGGCSALLNQATCPGNQLGQLSVDLRDGSDAANLSSGRVVPVIAGGPGDDNITVTITADQAYVEPAARISGGEAAFMTPSNGSTGETGTGNDVISVSGRAGDPNVAGGLVSVVGGDGNDTLFGGPEGDTFAGGPGDDVEHAGGGNDVLDFYGEIGESLAVKAADGADLLDGGPGLGRDTIDGVEAGPPAPDTISCGDGGEVSQSWQPWDVTWLGAGDRVGTDCEVVTQRVPCPSGGPPCSGELTLEAIPGGKAAAAAAAKKRGTRRVRFGKARFKQIPAGAAANVLVPQRLKPKDKKRLFRHRLTARATASVRIKRKKRLVTTRRTPFVLAKR